MLDGRTKGTTIDAQLGENVEETTDFEEISSQARDRRCAGTRSTGARMPWNVAVVPPIVTVPVKSNAVTSEGNVPVCTVGVRPSKPKPSSAVLDE